MAIGLPRKRADGLARQDTTSSMQWITIHESELRVMAGSSSEWADRETPGSLYGLWTHAGRPVILLATPGGPNALRSIASCRIDSEFFERTSRIIQELTGAQWLGNWHAHYTLGLDRPSAVDVGQVQSVAQEHGLDRWTTIITTIQRPKRSAASPPGDFRRGSSRGHGSPTVGLHGFVFTEPQTGEYVRARIRALPETSPVRLALLRCGDLGHGDLGEDVSGFSTEHLRYVSTEPQSQAAAETTPVFPALAQEIRRLPAQAREQIELTAAKGLVVVGSCLPMGQRALIAVEAEPPHPIRAAHILSASRDRAEDVSAEVLATGQVSLLQAYGKLASLSRLRSRIAAYLPPEVPEEEPTDERRTPLVPAGRRRSRSGFSKFRRRLSAWVRRLKSKGRRLVARDRSRHGGTHTPEGQDQLHRRKPGKILRRGFRSDR